MKIAGRYEVTAKLGEGGMGVVYRAYDPIPMDREVAVKTLHEFTDPLALDLFYKECRALMSISHPNIVEIFDMGEFEEGGQKKPFFVMPLLPGQTLDELIRKSSHRLTVDRVVEIISQTCRGLQAAHERGLVHRDLKPSNIFVMADDSVKLIDFGVAHAVSAHSRTTSFEKGTLLYMAPEQIQHKPVSAQSDVYALGLTAYEALTRRHPFRGATETAVIQSILSLIPQPASELNPAVSHMVSRAVHKAMAKQPWNRYDSAREFGETLQKALRNEPIAMFDPARTQPRIQTAAKALEKGDYQFAGEIVGELEPESEGNLDPQISMLRAQIDQMARQKVLAQLLESARARYEEEEDPLALQKLQEVLQLDPTNVTALGLKGRIEDRRSERQIEKWIQLARQHLDNHSYSHAHEALQNALVLRPTDSRAARLLKEIESAEQEYLRLRQEKSDLYQAAVNAWKNGDVSHALSQMRRVLELDTQAPDAASSAGETGKYQSFYDKIRSEHDAINNGYAEARRHLADRQFAPALETCASFLARYPGHALFHALKLDIEEQQRQRLSEFIADVNRRLDSEPDLDAKLNLVREAADEYPDEVHFTRLARTVADKRDLVNSIVERSRLHEARAQFSEALADLDTLQTVYGTYPGLAFERDRVQKRLEQHMRETARVRWVSQVRQQINAGDYARAIELLDKAREDYPDDPELTGERKLAEQGLERTERAEALFIEGQRLCREGDVEPGIELLRSALHLDDRPLIRITLRDLLVARAQASLPADWAAAARYADSALDVDPNHALAKSLRARAHDKKRDEAVESSLGHARRLQDEGDTIAARTEIEQALALYPGDDRLERFLTILAQDFTETMSLPPVAPSRPALNPAANPQAEASVDDIVPTLTRPASPPIEKPSLVNMDSGKTVVRPVERTTLRTSQPRVDWPSTSSPAPPRVEGQKPRPVPQITRAANRSTPVPNPPERMRPPQPPQRILLAAGALVVVALTVAGLVWNSSREAGVPRGADAPSPPPPSPPAAVTAPTSAPVVQTSPAPAPTPQPIPASPPRVRGALEPTASTPTVPSAPATQVPLPTGAVPTPVPGRGAVPPVIAAQDQQPSALPNATRAAQLLESATQSERARDWPAALRDYENARALDAGVAAAAGEAIARVQAQMLSEGTDAFTRARQYDALNRVDDAIAWYERAFRNLPDGANRRAAAERLRVLGAGR